MRNRLIIDGNAVYELDEECVRKKQGHLGVSGGGCQDSCPRSGKQKGKER